jgi:hypothetical protein
MIRNQSIIVQIPNPPQVKSFPTPIPVSPIINRSIPNCPANIEIINEVVDNLQPKPISNKVYTQQEMVALGGNYNCYHGMLMMIPVSKIDGLDPVPGSWLDDNGEEHDFKKGGKPSQKPIEVWYDKDNDVYTLYDGNHRVNQAKINGDKYIKAFVQAESKDIYRQWQKLFLNESLEWYKVVAGTLIFTGVYLTNKKITHE